jgi:hypothetical protein
MGSWEAWLAVACSYLVERCWRSGVELTMPHAILKKTFQRHFVGSAVSSVPVVVVVVARSVVHIISARDSQWRFKLFSSVHAARTSLKY